MVGAILVGSPSQVAAVRAAINGGQQVGGVIDALRAGRWNALAA